MYFFHIIHSVLAVKRRNYWVGSVLVVTSVWVQTLVQQQQQQQHHHHHHHHILLLLAKKKNPQKKCFRQKKIF